MIPGPDELSEQYAQEDPGSAEDEGPEPNEEEIVEPDAGELPEQYGADETPDPHKAGIVEPDTSELLEKFGSEYDDNETMGSSLTLKFPFLRTREVKKPARTPAQPGLGISGAADDALFLSPGKPRPVKSPVNRIQIIVGGVVLIFIIGAVYFIGMTMFSVNSPEADITALPAETTVPTISPIPAETPVPVTTYSALLPKPTQLVPTDQKFFFQVQKNPITAKILVTFTGSGILRADVKVTHPGGAVATGTILPLKGVNEISIVGSKDTDRVEIIASVASGETYRVYDDLIPFYGPI
ncbi:MAG: hypothetical protein M0Q92_11270 [Methanoregula sp.]|nr:hypothetical protein [Methanoregula sp.]